jgi:hypothetical protein
VGVIIESICPHLGRQSVALTASRGFPSGRDALY